MTVQNQTAAGTRADDNSTKGARELTRHLLMTAPSRGLEAKCDALSKVDRDAFVRWIIETLETRVGARPLVSKLGAHPKSIAELQAAFLRLDDSNQFHLFCHACHVDELRLVTRYNDLRLRDAALRCKPFYGTTQITGAPIAKQDVVGRAFAAYGQWCTRRGIPNEATECSHVLDERTITIYTRSDAYQRALAKYKIGRGYSLKRLPYKPAAPVPLGPRDNRGWEFFVGKCLTPDERSKLKAQMHVAYGAVKAWPEHLRFIAKAT